MIKFFIKIVELLGFLFFLGFGWLCVLFFKPLIEEFLPEYNPAFFLGLPICTFWLLNSFIFYNYVGVHSGFEAEGLRESSDYVEFPSEIFHRSEKGNIEDKIVALEKDEHAGADISTKRFLFIETGLINGFESRNGIYTGFIKYIKSAFFALLEYILLSLMYIGIPLLFYEAHLIKSGKLINENIDT